MADKIQVAVRVRPVLFQKKDVEIHWGCEQGMVVQLEPGTRKRIGNPYLFNHVFGTETQNYQIFESVVQPLIDSAMDGFNVTVLAYGQTASGKTYTMMGSQKELGIVQLAVDRIFDIIEKNPERAFLLRCSYIEIYNETISDLLSPTPHQKLKVQELAEGHVQVQHLTETNVNVPEAVLKLMNQGNKQRKVGGTSMNERSSRSHTIFRIIVESVPRAEADRNEAAVIVSHINLVDLAGSEKASQTNATGDRFREGCAINTSLSALSLVIKQLSEGEGFVNFRDSKLTHILRASLGGNARTAIICNVTPTVLDETSSTLKFASSAKTVSNQPHVNEILSDQALLRKYNNYIKDLEKKLKEKEQEKQPGAIEEMQRLLEEKDMKIHELKEQLVVSSCSAGVVGRSEDSLTSAQRSLRRMTWGGNRLKQLNFAERAFDTPSFARPRLSNFSSSEVNLHDLSATSENEEVFVSAERVFPRMTTPTSATPVVRVDASTMTDSPLPPMPGVIDSPGGIFKRPGTPSTPAVVLRERVSKLQRTLSLKEQENEDLREELDDLTNFTRLEQQIGVHAPVSAKLSTDESAERLHLAQQTANDMEVLYLDSQRKLSELQTQYRSKEVEYETQIQTQEASFRQQLEAESTEKKRLAKELTELKSKHERLEMDHSEADTHVQVLTERYAKREADLRSTLQEAWTQLERLGQDPKALQAESLAAKEQIERLEKRLQESEAMNLEAQSRIDSLKEELHQAQEVTTTHRINEENAAKEQIEQLEKRLQESEAMNLEAQSRIDSLKEELRQAQEATRTDRINEENAVMDNSLDGMTLADELRDVMGSASPFFPQSSSRARPRKRPSSILSVTLAKMDQSTTMLDTSDMVEVETKKTRLSIQSLSNGSPCESNDSMELGCIREQLIVLQTALVHFEREYEVINKEKDALTTQLSSAQTELVTLRSELENEKKKAASKNGKDQKLDGSFRSAVGVDLSSCSNTDDTSNMDMEQSGEEDEPFISSSSLNLPDEEEMSEEGQQQHQLRISQLTEQLHRLQDTMDEKNTELDQARRALQAAQASIVELEQQVAANEEGNKLKEQLSNANDQIQILEADLSSERIAAEEARNSLQTLSTDNKDLQSRLNLLTTERDELEKRLQELQVSLEEAVDPIRFQTVQEELTAAQERAVSLEAELELLRQSEKEKFEEHERLTTQLKELEEALELKNQQIVSIQQAAEESVTAKQEVEEERQKWQVELDRALEESRELKQLNEDLRKELNESAVKTEELLSSIQRGEPTDTMDLQTTLEEMQASLHEFRVSSEQLQTQVAAFEQELASEKEVANALKLELAEKQEEIKRLQSITEASKEVEELNQHLQSNMEEIQRLQSALEEAMARNSHAEELVKELELKEGEIQQLKSCQAGPTESSLELELKEEEIRTLRRNLEEMAEHNQQLSSTDEEIQRLQLLQDRSTELVRQLEQKEEEIAELNRQLCSKDEEMEQLQSLQDQSAELVRQLEQKEEEIAELNRQLSSKGEEMQRLQSLQDQSTELVRQLEQKEEEIKRLGGSLEELDELNGKLAVKEEETRQLQSLREQTEELMRQLELKEEEIGRLRGSLEEFDELNHKLASKEEELQELLSFKEQSVDLARQLELKDGDIQRLRSTLEDLELQLKSKEEETSALQSATEQSTELRQQLNQKEEEISNLKSSLEHLDEVKGLLELKESEVRQLQATLLEASGLEQQLKLKEEDILRLQSVLEEVKTQTERLVSRCELDEAIKKIEEMEKRIEVDQLSAQEAERKIVADRNALQEKLQEAQDRLTRLADELNAARVAQQSGLVGLESELNRAVERAAGLERSLEEKTGQLDAASEDLAAVRSQVLSLEQEAVARLSQLTASQQELDSLSRRNLELDELMQQLKTDLNSREEELVNLQAVASKVSNLEARLQRNEADLAAASVAIEQKTEQSRRLEEQLVQVAGNQSSDLEQLKHVSERLQEREKQLDLVRRNLEEMQTTNDSLVSRLNDEEEIKNELQKKLESFSHRFSAIEAQLDSVRSKEKQASSRVQELEAELDGQQQELEGLRESSGVLQNERQLNVQLRDQLSSLRADKDVLIHQCDEFRGTNDTLRQNYEDLLHQVEVLTAAGRSLEEERVKLQTEKDAILADYARLKSGLEEAEIQLESIRKQRDESVAQERILSSQVNELRSRNTTLETAPRIQAQRQLEEENQALRRDLRDMRSKCDVLQLNFESEEDNRKKKIDRLEKELEALKKEYTKCKEQLRLSRHHVNDDGTVVISKPHASIATESVLIQTDPIADKGFGFRWQMDQYVGDNERLRKKVSEVGERMEFYKEKLIKYRTLYFEAVGQDQQSRSSGNSSNQASERPSSGGARENTSDASEPIKTHRGKTSLPSAAPAVSSGTLSAHQEGAAGKGATTSTAVPSAGPTGAASKWAGVKKQTLSKEEMEKINNCNPS